MRGGKENSVRPTIPEGPVLVVRFSSLGDLVLMVPLLRALREGYPDRSIEVLTKKEYLGLFEAVPWVDEVHTLSGGGLLGLLKIIGRLGHRRYSLLVDAHDVIRSRLVSLMVPAARKVRLEKDQLRKTLLVKSGRNLYRETPSMVDRYLRIASVLGLGIPDGEARLSIPSRHMDAARRMIEDAGLAGKDLVAMAPGARWPEKRWPADNFGLLAERLAGSGLGVVLIGNGEEAGLCRRIAGSLSGSLNAAGRTGVVGTAALLSMCRCLVTNDSAPLHLAEAVGTPVVAFFGPTVREFGFYPRLGESLMLERDVGCRPCSRNGSRECSTGSRECLTTIGADEAFSAVEGLLNAAVPDEGSSKA